MPLKIARFEKPDFEIFPATPIPSQRAAASPKGDGNYKAKSPTRDAGSAADAGDYY
ncbi:MAG: hypothetical protein R2861_02615 [Desulfobacterales bacterium]